MNRNSNEVISYFHPKSETKYHVKTECISLCNNCCHKNLEYDLNIEMLSKSGQIYQFRFEILNTKGTKTFLTNIGKFYFDINIDSDGNFIELANWESIKYHFTKYTNFTKKEEIVNSLSLLIDQLFFLYGKSLSNKNSYKYLSLIYLNEDNVIDADATLEIITEANDEILIGSNLIPSYESDLIRLNISNVSVNKKYILNTSKNVLIYSESETSFHNGVDQIKNIRTIKLIE